jgi:signal transduction histidine kinase
MTDQLSIVDRPITLSEIFEPELFADLCRTYVELYHIGIRIYDRENHRLVDLPHGTGLHDYVFGIPAGQRGLTTFIGALTRTDPEPGQYVLKDDGITGARYMLAAITSDTEVLGKIILGPYLPDGADVQAPPPGELGDVDTITWSRLRGEMRRVRDGTLRKVTDALLKAIDIVCHAGYRAVLTSNMHLESIDEAYAALQRKNAELEEKNRRLRELDKLKSNFLATVSHELRTPLTSVIGYSEMLLEGLAGDLTEEQHEYVATIMDKGEALLHLISGILDISKIESGTAEVVRDRTVPRALVDAAVSTLRPAATKKGVELVVDCGDDLPAVSVDSYKIRQVLINLLNNAIKFTAQGGTIKAAVAYDPAVGRVRFEVRDNGIGIPPDKLDKIFETFFQVDNTSTREYGGTGLGLSIVRSFVESHGGDVGVDSEEGRGSTFHFTIPAAPTDEGV